MFVLAELPRCDSAPTPFCWHMKGDAIRFSEWCSTLHSYTTLSCKDEKQTNTCFSSCFLEASLCFCQTGDWKKRRTCKGDLTLVLFHRQNHQDSPVGQFVTCQMRSACSWTLHALYYQATETKTTETDIQVVSFNSLTGQTLLWAWLCMMFGRFCRVCVLLLMSELISGLYIKMEDVL